MTDDPRAHLDDEALSAVLDGEGTDDEARHVAGCSACQTRLDALRSVSGAVGSPVPALDADRLDAAVAAALSAQNVVPLSVARSARRPPAWLGAAAAVAAVLAVGGLLARASDGDRSSDDQVAASDATEDSASAESAGGGTSDEMQTLDSDVAADAPAASSLAGASLGELRGADLRAVVEDGVAQRNAGAEPAPTTVMSDGSGGAGGTTSASPVPAPCEPELRAADPSLGAVAFTGDGTWDGEPVAVVVFEVGAERRAFVVAYDGCVVRSSASWSD